MPSLSERLAASAVSVGDGPKIDTFGKLSERLGSRGRQATDFRFLRGKTEEERGGGVQNSQDLARILALPRRDNPQIDLTSELKSDRGEMTLRPIQSAALADARETGGLLAPVGVGHGKTLISLLLPTVLSSARAVLLVPASLFEQLLRRDLPLLGKHWRIKVGSIHVVSYSQLSSAKSADVLDRIAPDLIVADEAHNLRNRTAARTKRFLRYFREHPGTRFCGMSGTLTTRSLRDYAHLSELALGDGSPLPRHFPTLIEWSQAIDPAKGESIPLDMGALSALCEPGETVRQGFRRRLVSTPGVIATEEGALGTSLVIEERPLSLDSAASAELQKLRASWTRPDGEELEDALAFGRTARQMAAGFFYRWKWPTCSPCLPEVRNCANCNGKGFVVDWEWLQARGDWHKEVRSFLAHSARPGMDSPLLLAQAAARFHKAREKGESTKGLWEPLFWEAWARVKDREPPPVETIWISDFLCVDAVAWGKEEAGIIWYEHDAIGKKIAELGGFPFYGPGEDASIALAAEADAPEPRTIVCSIRAHGTGKNLQPWSRNLVTTPPGNGAIWEQLLGRTHRPGQEADEVSCHLYRHTPEMQNGFTQAQSDAKYIEQSTGQKQKLCYANVAF